MRFNQTIQKHIAAAALAIGLAVPCAADQGEAGVIVHILSGADINAIAASHGATVIDSIPDKSLYRLQSPTENDDALIQQLTGAAGVDYVEEDSVISSAEVVGDPFHFSFDINANPGTFLQATSYAQINLGQAQVVTRGFGVIVAVLDTGVATAHPALQNNIMAGLNVVLPGAAPEDIPDGASNTDVGHGTMIAGLITHLAPNAAILPVRLMNADGAGTLFSVAQGIHYAVTHGAKVISMSFNATSASHMLSDALDEAETAGVVVVAAAGNANADQAQLAALHHGAIIVASVESDNTKSSYSNYGKFVGVVAPGSGVRSAFWNNQYATWSGTSFAAPMVAAEAALMLAANPTMAGDEVVSIIRNTAHSIDKINPNYKGMLGNGVIDIQAAVSKAGGTGTPPANATVSGTINLEGLAANAPTQNVTLTFRPTDGSASFDRTAAIGVTNTFSFSGIPAKNYTLHAKADRYLAVNLAVNATFSNVTALNVTLAAGDANNDNSVDTIDFGILVGAYGGDASIPGSGYDATADFNGDGLVDVTDFGLLVGNYGASGDL